MTKLYGKFQSGDRMGSAWLEHKVEPRGSLVKLFLVCDHKVGEVYKLKPFYIGSL